MRSIQRKVILFHRQFLPVSRIWRERVIGNITFMSRLENDNKMQNKNSTRLYTYKVSFLISS